MSAKKRILVIDDTPEKRELFNNFLTLRGFDISMAVDGHSGYQAAVDQLPDLIILDLQLPDIMGTEVCHMLRQEAKTKDIPILIVTASSRDPNDRVWGFRAGADDYISAPVQLDELLERVYAVLRRTGSREKPFEEPAPVPDLGPAPILEPAAEVAAPPECKAKGHLFKILAQRVYGSLLHPSMVFSSVDEGQDFPPVILIVLAIPLLESFTALSQGGGMSGWTTSFATSAFLSVLAWLAVSGLAHMIMPFSGSDAPWRRVAVVVGLGSCPKLLAAGLAVVYAGLAAWRPMIILHPLSSGIDLIPGFHGLSGPLQYAARIGVFDLWSAYLTTSGLIAVCKVQAGNRFALGTLSVLAVLGFGVFTAY